LPHISLMCMLYLSWYVTRHYLFKTWLYRFAFYHCQKGVRLLNIHEINIVLMVFILLSLKLSRWASSSRRRFLFQTWRILVPWKVKKNL